MALSYRQAKAIFEALPDARLRQMSPLRSVEGLAYCPHKPLPKQRAFLELDCLEALYGGAAGPGKTDALLMAALQYVHVPNYAALILRRDFARLSLPGSIMDRAKMWLRNTDARWNGSEHSFRFPSGAVLQFGYIDNPEDRFRYASAEFQFIGWDELTEFRLDAGEANPYEFMFSRLRKTADIPVPLRMRAGSNPGNIGHSYVKRRFVSDEALEHLRAGEAARVFYADPVERTRAFVPALLADNPFIDHDAYVAGLMHLPSVTRARLLAGDWSVIEDALIKAEWLRDYRLRGDMLLPLDAAGEPLRNAVIDRRTCFRFVTIDTAGTTKQKAAEKKGKPPSFSVCQVWDFHPEFNLLFLRFCWRERVDWSGLKAGVRETIRAWSPQGGYIENAHFGPALHDELLPEFSFLQLVSPVQPYMKGESGVPGKVERASPLLSALENGRVFLPLGETAWRPALEAEWLSWTGAEDETSDQVDCASYAAALDHVSGLFGETMVIEMPLGR